MASQFDFLNPVSYLFIIYLKEKQCFIIYNIVFPLVTVCINLMILLSVCIDSLCRYHSVDAAKVVQLLGVSEIVSEFESNRNISVYCLFA